MGSDILSLIDNAIDDYLSDDAMRWRPEPPKPAAIPVHVLDVTNGARGQSFFDRGEHVTIGSEPTWICSLLLCLTRLLVAYRILRLRKTVIRE